ncbi:MAG TPA: glycosyl hydrolase [Thermoplasmata archaeon]|nr:glycosyl hydrolase [Thermoplasmata archaeon]
MKRENTMKSRPIFAVLMVVLVMATAVSGSVSRKETKKGPVLLQLAFEGFDEKTNRVRERDVPSYKDPNLSVEERVEDLLSRMTLREKVAQMGGKIPGDEFTTRYNDRLGIPEFRFTDGPRGVRWENATCFPVPMARGSTWDPELEKRVGEAMGIETRARGRNVLLAPCINLVRHPRGGRSQETYGEDPYHVGRVGIAFIEGVQSRKVMACAKHYAVNNHENTRRTNNAGIDERTLREIYLPHFKACVKEGDVASIMSAYNLVNGQYCSENHHLLKDILKDEWEFKGFVVSDWFACHSIADSISAGLDVEMPFAFYYGRRLLPRVKLGMVSEEAINDAARRILRQKFSAGLFDEEFSLDERIDESIVECEEHTHLTQEVEREAIVLLKNNDHILPLSMDGLGSIAVIGPAADDVRLGDHGSSNVVPSYAITPLQGIKNKVGNKIEVYHSDGSDLTEASELAKKSDVAILVVGLSYKDEGEGKDRESMDLLGNQVELIKKVAVANKNCVVVLIGGSAITMDPWIDEVPAILMAWYPGQEGGNAIADVLFGDYNPGGKLPITFPKSENQLPDFDNNDKETIIPYYHGYRHFDKYGLEPLFPFGYGLSYTEFEYSNLELNQKKIGPDGTVRISVDVKNVGDRKGDEVVQLYVGYVGSRVDRPVKELKGFKRVGLQPGEAKTVTFELKPDELAYYNLDITGWEVEPIRYPVYVGASSRDMRLRDMFEITTERITPPEEEQPELPQIPWFGIVIVLAVVIVIATVIAILLRRKKRVKK